MHLQTLKPAVMKLFPPVPPFSHRNLDTSSPYNNSQHTLYNMLPKHRMHSLAVAFVATVMLVSVVPPELWEGGFRGRVIMYSTNDKHVKRYLRLIALLRLAPMLAPSKIQAAYLAVATPTAI